MAKNVKFELNIKGLNELMKSEAMCQCLQAAGNNVSASAGTDYGTRVHQASFVAICNVYPDSKSAAKDNYKNNTLLKAIGSAGLSTRK